MDCDYRGEWILTYTGRRFYPLDPRPGDIVIEDIAHALAMKCRFNGHVKKFYSVALHSLYVSLLLEQKYPTRPNLALWGLLHDAAEAYIPDIARPFKNMNIGIFKIAEERIMDVVAYKFLDPQVEPPEVKHFDISMCLTEGKWLMPNIDDWGFKEKTLDLRLADLPIAEVEDMFLTQYYLLS